MPSSALLTVSGPPPPLSVPLVPGSSPSAPPERTLSSASGPPVRLSAAGRWLSFRPGPILPSTGATGPGTGLGVTVSSMVFPGARRGGTPSVSPSGLGLPPSACRHSAVGAAAAPGRTVTGRLLAGTSPLGPPPCVLGRFSAVRPPADGSVSDVMARFRLALPLLLAGDGEGAPASSAAGSWLSAGGFFKS